MSNMMANEIREQISRETEKVNELSDGIENAIYGNKIFIIAGAMAISIGRLAATSDNAEHARVFIETIANDALQIALREMHGTQGKN